MALQKDLKQNLDQLVSGIAEVEAVATGINERIRQRLEQRIRRMIGDRYDAQRMPVSDR